MNNKQFTFDIKDCNYLFVANGLVELSIKEPITLINNSKYKFFYKHKKRFVKLIKEFPDYLHCRCIKPDKSAGGFRNFNKEDIFNLEKI